MAFKGGFKSLEQAENFALARIKTQFGGTDRALCGARTRNGSTCGRVPLIEGRGRCLLHCGPKAANEYRERQRAMFHRGEISAPDWQKAEMRRALNRLRDLWKRNPWHPGTTIDLGGGNERFLSATIDLGGGEAAFLDAARLAGVDVGALPPALADWLRWRWQRTQIDRQNPDGWRKAVGSDLKDRVAKAGPSGGSIHSPQAERLSAPPPPVPGQPSAKRARGDMPRAPKAVRGKGYGRRGRPSTRPVSDQEGAELGEVYRAMIQTLAPLKDYCRAEHQWLHLLRVARDLMQAPGDGAVMARWQQTVTSLARSVSSQ